MDNAMKYLWVEWDKLKATLLSKREKLLLLDFDGTLLPIAPAPSAVRLPSEVQRLLQKLARMPRQRVAFLSGRPLKELRRQLKVRGAFYAANHGLEFHGWNLPLPENAQKARRQKGLIRLLAQKFQNSFASVYDGLLVEDKKYTVSLHYRNLPKDQKTLFDEQVRFFQRKYRKYPLTWVHGKKVWEVRPSVTWGKGDTALYLTKRFRNALPIAIGDDRVDEDMFRVVKKKGITIRVGHLKSSHADYYVASPYDVQVFLRKLCRS